MQKREKHLKVQCSGVILRVSNSQLSEYKKIYQKK